LPGLFFLAAAMILAVQLPLDRLILNLVKFIKPSRLAKVSVLTMIGVLLAAKNAGSAQRTLRAIHLIEVSPPSGPLYTIREEKELITAAFEIAIKDYKSTFPDCEFGTSEHVIIGTTRSMETLLRERDLARSGNVLIGFSRTDFARTAAALARSSGAIGISVGAAGGHLRTINPRFFSIVPDLLAQWRSIESGLRKHSCNSENTKGVFDPGSFISSEYRSAFEKGRRGQIINLDQAHPENLEDSCLFIGTNLSSALPVLKRLQDSQWKGLIFGTGDWVINEREIKGFWRNIPSGPGLLAPTSWARSGHPLEERFEQRILSKTGKRPTALGAFTYDATVTGLHQICSNAPNRNEPISGVPVKMLLRSYSGMQKQGNARASVILVNPAESL